MDGVECNTENEMNEKSCQMRKSVLCVLCELICLMPMTLEKEDSSTETFKSVPMGCAH